MGELDQKEYWNNRAKNWADYQEPLIPSLAEQEFQRKHLVPGGRTLVLGVTPQLCVLAREMSESVTSVDFAEELIEELRMDGIEYICQDWMVFLEAGGNGAAYDNIITDGGLLSLRFPDDWSRIIALIYRSLRPGGIFAARVYLSTGNPPKQQYDNPSLGRFVSSMGDVDENWMVHPKHPAYEKYDMHYAFPPREVVMRMLSQFTFEDEYIPSYEEGDRFVSLAFRRPE